MTQHSPPRPTCRGQAYDLIVVGAGIMGLATAYQAHQRGLSVLVIEAHSAPVGASIQNFGFACFTGQADSTQELMERSRNGWLDAADKTGLWASTTGAYLPAMSELEMQILEEFAAHRGPEQARLLSPSEIAQATGCPHLARESVGGAHMPRDVRVNPREAAPTLATWLAQQGVDFAYRTVARHIDNGTVETSRGTFHAEHVAVCPGESLWALYPDIAEKYNLRTCTLAMSAIARPSRIPDNLAMLTSTAILRHSGFGAMPSTGKLGPEWEARDPELMACDPNLMITALPDRLLIGDSHDYAHSPTPFVQADTSEVMLSRACAYLGIDTPRVLERWQGRYASSPGTTVIHARPDAATTIAVVSTGIGMTMAFGLAEAVLNGDSLPAF